MTGDITQVQTRYGPLVLDSVHDKKMWQVFRRGGYPNEELLVLAKQFLTPESVAVDVGAHIGTFAISLAEISQVVAFEPAPETFSLLEHNTKKAKGIFDLRNIGLAARSGTATLVERNATNAGAQTLAPDGDLPISTLDTEIADASFIKIDVEGMEMEVLRGASRLISRCRPVVVFEVNISQLRAHGASVQVLEQFFIKHKYALFLPLFNKPTGRLARIRSLRLLTLCIAPRAYLLHKDSAPFDVFALPAEYTGPVPRIGFASALSWAVISNLHNKLQRLRALLSLRDI